ncbi:hypothetical protein GCM10022394_04750 [Zobellella aerophila]|uniref:Uncharacterized protein n=1 Tax=Zobellella aerophila TaxID=870480 RepID=A0ABP6V484_9GAMM
MGGFLAILVIGYGMVQSLAPRLTGKKSGKVPDGLSVDFHRLYHAGGTDFPGPAPSRGKRQGISGKRDPAYACRSGFNPTAR